MTIMFDDGARTGIQIERTIGQEDVVVRESDGVHKFSPMVERYTLIDIGGGREAMGMAAYNAAQSLYRAMWKRVGMEESRNHQQVVITGTNNKYVRIA